VDYRLLFTQRALSDLSGIVGRIAQDDGEAATRFGQALLDHVDLLGRFPHMGNTIRKRTQVRKLIHSRFSFTTESMRRSDWSRSSTFATDRADRQNSEIGSFRKPFTVDCRQAPGV